MGDSPCLNMNLGYAEYEILPTLRPIWLCHNMTAPPLCTASHPSFFFSIVAIAERREAW